MASEPRVGPTMSQSNMVKPVQLIFTLYRSPTENILTGSFASSKNAISRIDYWLYTVQ